MRSRAHDVIGSVTNRPIDSPWALSYYTHWNNYNVCTIKLTMNIASLGIGDGWGIGGNDVTSPPKK